MRVRDRDAAEHNYRLHTRKAASRRRNHFGLGSATVRAKAISTAAPKAIGRLVPITPILESGHRLNAISLLAGTFNSVAPFSIAVASSPLRCQAVRLWRRFCRWSRRRASAVPASWPCRQYRPGGRYVQSADRAPAPAEAPRNQEPGPHGARSQFYPTRQANAGRRAAFRMAKHDQRRAIRPRRSRCR
jgi:hypothetical protein